ncbi:MAG: hypothetical protein WBA77_00260 [Microcoleaceae cyanobacterium]
MAIYLYLIIFTATSSKATILWNQITTFGEIEPLKIPFYPPTAEYIDLGIAIPDSRNILAFDERQNVVLPRNIKIAKPNPNSIEVEAFANYDAKNLSDTNLAYDWDADYETLPELNSGMRVNSHFIAYGYTQQPPYTYVHAMITFDGPIIGLIDSRDSHLTDDLFSLTNYSARFTNDSGADVPQTLEGLQWNKNNFGQYSQNEELFLQTRDYVKITGEYHNILEIRWATTGYEALRVLTLAQ